MSKRGCRRILGLLTLLAIGGIVGGVVYVKGQLAPMPEGKPFYIRFESGATFAKALEALHDRGVVRNPAVLRTYARFTGKGTDLKVGTYQLAPGMDADAILTKLRSPVRQMVRIPETNLSYRTANLLSKYEVCPAKDYRALIKQPQAFAKSSGLPLPRKGNLEGYLYPDTYDLPPLLGAKGVVERQLAGFKAKAWPLLKGRKDVQRVLTVASMVELEAGTDGDRPLIAGVIENRLRQNMALQIDATLLYAISEWRRLTFKDYKTIDSPYSTYKNRGLPPGPICSPSVKSIEAALHPAQHDYLYYVARPDKTHAFARTYSEHVRNIATIRAQKP